MDHFCDVCEKNTKYKSKSIHFQSLTHHKLNKCLRKKHTIENPDSFVIDILLNLYVTRLKKTEVSLGK